jgi:hypothetical protein
MMLNTFSRVWIPAHEDKKGNYREARIEIRRKSENERIEPVHVTTMYFVWRTRRLTWHRVREAFKSRNEPFFEKNLEIIIEETEIWPEKAKKFIFT